MKKKLPKIDILGLLLFQVSGKMTNVKQKVPKHVQGSYVSHIGSCLSHRLPVQKKILPIKANVFACQADSQSKNIPLSFLIKIYFLAFLTAIFFNVCNSTHPILFLFLFVLLVLKGICFYCIYLIDSQVDHCMYTWT